MNESTTATSGHSDIAATLPERSYIGRTIATIRQHNPNNLRENWWTGAALALADEVERLRTALGEIASYPACDDGHQDIAKEALDGTP